MDQCNYHCTEELDSMDLTMTLHWCVSSESARLQAVQHDGITQLRYMYTQYGYLHTREMMCQHSILYNILLVSCCCYYSLVL